DGCRSCAASSAQGFLDEHSPSECPVLPENALARSAPLLSGAIGGGLQCCAHFGAVRAGHGLGAVRFGAHRSCSRQRVGLASWSQESPANLFFPFILASALGSATGDRPVGKLY